MNKNGTVSPVGKASIEAHDRLENGEGLSFFNIFKAGAEWLAEQADEWLSENIENYVTWEGDVEYSELQIDFQRAMARLTDNENC